MFVIQFTVCASLIFAISFALPTPTYVYSAILHNKQDNPVRCMVIWESSNGQLPQKDLITIPSNNFKVINERDVDMGTWVASASIKEIRCGSLILTHPFQGVYSVVKLWNFDIEPTEIVSVGPTVQ